MARKPGTWLENYRHTRSLPTREYVKLMRALPVIPYRPLLMQITGDIAAAILLQQILYWWRKKGYKPFYKFQRPPETAHGWYRKGDSWEEELGFPPRMVQSALRKIATRTPKRDIGTVLGDTAAVFGLKEDRRLTATRPILLNAHHLVVYHLNPNHLSYYIVNEPLLEDALRQIKKPTSKLRK